MSDVNIVSAVFDYSNKDVAQAATELAAYLIDTFKDEGGFLQMAVNNTAFDVLEMQAYVNKHLADSANLLRIYDLQRQDINSFVVALRCADIHEVLGLF